MIKLFLLAGLSFFNPRQDSIGIETINGKIFVIHKVGEKETLYGISKHYNVTVSQILEFNPTADAGLDIGQLLKVPYVPKPKPILSNTIHSVAEKETLYSISKIYGVTIEDIRQWNNLTDNSLALGQKLIIKSAASTQTSTPSVSNTDSNRKVHTVGAQETLYSISRQYGLTIQQITEWNGLLSQELKIGQVLIVSPPTAAGEAVAANNLMDSQNSAQVIVQPSEKENVVTISESVKDKSELKESGLAELIEGTDGNRKYLALHRSIPVGTIVKVRNEMNNREVFVRIVGTLPETALTDRLIIKVSKSAYDRLGAIDPRFRVEVTYYK